MAEKEEIIFEFKIEQADAFSELERTKKAILQIKEEQNSLNKAYAKGTITLDEYVKESLRQEQLLKKTQEQYKKLDKTINTTSNSLNAQRQRLIELKKIRDEIDRSTVEGTKKFDAYNKKILELNESIKEAEAAGGDFQRNVGDYVKEVNVAGVSMGNLTDGFTKFLNPLGAAAAGVSALGALYVNSTRGAQDLERANDLLAASLDVLSNKLFTGQGGKFSANSIFGFLQSFGPTSFFAAGAKLLLQDEIDQVDELANARKRLRDIELLDLKDAQKAAKDALKIAEQNRRYRDDEEKDLQNRLAAANDVEGSINEFESALLKVQKDRLAAANEILKLNETDVQARSLVKDIEREIADIQEDAEGKRTEALNGVLAIQKLITGQIRNQRLLNVKEFGVKDLSDPNFKDAGDEKRTDELIKGNADLQIGSAEYLTQVLDKEGKKRAENERKNSADELAAREYADNARLESAVAVTGAIAGLFKEGSELQKFFALTSIGIDTAQAIAALTAASEGNPANAVTFGGAGIAQYASGIVRILSNIAAASQYLGGRAAGGGDFYTKGPAMLMVGDNPGGIERVTVEPISGKGKTVVNPRSNLIAMAGGGTLTAFNDGGLSVNSLTSSINESVMQQNMIKKAMKSMPVPILAVRDVKSGLDKVRVKDKLSKGR